MNHRPFNLIILILLFKTFLLISCTQSPPTILGFQVISLWNHNDERFLPTHLFIEVEMTNPPTIEDLREVIVRNPATQLSWQVNVGDVHYNQHRGRTVLVLPPLGFEPLGFDIIRPLPFGFYELEVVNLDGQLDRISFSFPRSMVNELFELYNSISDPLGYVPDTSQLITEYNLIQLIEVTDQLWVYRFF
jgi:hypothetical protein